MESNVLIKQRKGNIATLTFNRPERKNALSPELLVNLHLTLQEWEKEDTIRAVVITGNGDQSFSSGFDILSIPTEVPPEMAEIMKKENPVELALNTVKNYPYPTIAMMNGYAFGAALNLAICCDIRIGVDDIRIGMPPSKLGIVYHPEGIKQFVEVLGMAGTREIFFTGRTYKGVEAKEMGFVDHLVPRSDLAAVVYGYAEEIAENAPLSLKGSKKIINMLGQSTSFKDSDLIKAEEMILEAFNSQDLKEGQTAFLEKRKPVFKGC